MLWLNAKDKKVPATALFGIGSSIALHASCGLAGQGRDNIQHIFRFNATALLGFFHA